MKLEDFLRQNIDYLNNPSQDKGSFLEFLVMLVKFPLLAMWGFLFRSKFLGILFFLVLLVATNIHPIISNDVDFIFLKILLWFFNFYLFLFLFFTLVFTSFRIFGEDRRFRKKIIRKYKKLHNGNIVFSSEQYKKASDSLRIFKPLRPENAYKKYGEDIVDLLILTNGVYLFKGKLQRLVSIKSIEEDREAGPEDY